MSKGALSIRTVALILLGLLSVAAIFVATSGWVDGITSNFVDGVTFPNID